MAALFSSPATQGPIQDRFLLVLVLLVNRSPINLIKSSDNRTSAAGQPLLVWVHGFGPQFGQFPISLGTAVESRFLSLCEITRVN